MIEFKLHESVTGVKWPSGAPIDRFNVNLGLLPHMLDEDDPRPASEQFHTGYAHGGGWRPFEGFTLNPDDTLSYPCDPPTRPLAVAQLREETIILYEYSWVAIIQPDRTFEICRMD